MLVTVAPASVYDPVQAGGAVSKMADVAIGNLRINSAQIAPVPYLVGLIRLRLRLDRALPGRALAATGR